MTTALVLSGGGAKGFVHIGVIDYIIKHKVHIDLIIGTSMGSIVGAYYATHLEVDGLKKLVTKPDLRMFLDFISMNSLSKSLFKIDKIEKHLYSIIGDKDFSECRIPLFINATNIKTGKEYVFKDGSIIEAVKASICIPGIFEPIKIGTEYYVDGGCVDVLPHEIAERYHADKIIDSLVTMDPKSSFIEQDSINQMLKIKNYLETNQKGKIASALNAFRGKYPDNVMTTLIESIYCTTPQSLEKIKKDTTDNFILLTPKTQDIRGYDFHKAKILIQRGYEEAEKKIPDYF